jgi:predicted O-methyltransferase YrrM
MTTVPRWLFDVTEKSWHANPYLGPEETAIVIDLVRSVDARVMIEIGCQKGITAKNILKHAPSIEHYIGIDVEPDYVPTLRGQASEVPEVAGIEAGDDPRFELVIRPRGSLDLTPLDLEPCEAMFIDGDHSEAVVTHDSLFARRLVRPGGIIVWHDYRNPAVEVTAALDKLHERGWPIDHVENTWLAYMRV